MDLKDRMTNRLVVSAIAVVAIASSTVFIIQSLASAPSGRNVKIETEPVDLRNAATREAIAADQGLPERLRERFSSQENLAALSPRQIELLTDQLGDILSVRASGSMNDYIALMQSWGGVLMLSKEDIAEVSPGWRAPEHPDAIGKYAIDQLVLKVQDSPTQPRFRSTSHGEFALASISQFRFKARQADLLQGKTQEAQIMMPAETNEGDHLELQYSLLWSPQDDKWIPFQMTTISKKGKPIAGRIF